MDYITNISKDEAIRILYNAILSNSNYSNYDPLCNSKIDIIAIDDDSKEYDIKFIKLKVMDNASNTRTVFDHSSSDQSE